MLIYHYPTHFHSLHGHAFGRNDFYNRNTQGLYLGTQYKKSDQTHFKAYVDFNRLFLAKRAKHTPGWGQSAMFDASYRPSSSRNFSVNLKGTRGHQAKNRLKINEKTTLKLSYPFYKKQKAYTEFDLSCTYQGGATPFSHHIGAKQFFHYKNKKVDCQVWCSLFHKPDHGGKGGVRAGKQAPRSPHGILTCMLNFVLVYHITPRLEVQLKCTFKTSTKDAKEVLRPKVSLQITATSP